eukprot:scaffold159695_cov18-Tisochrysis_lutea.AAC.1
MQQRAVVLRPNVMHADDNSLEKYCGAGSDGPACLNHSMVHATSQQVKSESNAQHAVANALRPYYVVHAGIDGPACLSQGMVHAAPQQVKAPPPSPHDS